MTFIDQETDTVMTAYGEGEMFLLLVGPMTFLLDKGQALDLADMLMKFVRKKP